nr:glyoxysomal processing protease, glyoxysomal [Ipomoea batatas]GMD93105.1 glyoxysomal processing protease, glyoxysomal [Ipomoea batatas]GME13716.1 glyoxysomal processing protease, glyoxysomal [Ipomoea batatas]
MGKSTTRVALLRVSSTEYEGLPKIGTSHFNKRGDLLLSIGSPFGILSPIHFFNRWLSLGKLLHLHAVICWRSSLKIPGMASAMTMDS